MGDPSPSDSSSGEFHTTIIGGKDAVVDSADTGPLLEGDRVGGYEIDSLIGVGGGGIVYAAHRLTDGQRVAIKALRAEVANFPGMLERFKREAAMVQKIGHPNIVHISELGEIVPGRPYYVMELLHGRDLRKLLELAGRFSPKEALEYLEPVCDAVAAAHQAGIIHRDLKATNVLIAESEGKRVVKLLDFGIAKSLSDEANGQGLTRPGATLGTPHHMAPEQIRCEKVDARTDIYALGVLLYQLVTGHYPFNAEDFRQISLLHLHSPPPRPSALARVPPALDMVVLRCLEKAPDRRYQSVPEFLQALRGAVGDAQAGPAETTVQAVGVYFEVFGNGDDGDDDALFEDMSAVLDIVEQNFAARDYVFPLRTSNALLAVRRIPEGTDPAKARAGAEEFIAELVAVLEERDGKHPNVETSISLNVGDVVCRASAVDVSIVGGPLLKVSGWTTHHRLRSV